MSMPREEAIEALRYRQNIINNVDIDWCANEIAAIDVVLSALRHVSREQDLEDENMELKKRIVNWRKYMAPTREKVEQVWRGECDCSKPKACCTCCSMRCRYCIGQSEYRQATFCMKCGRPMTDEAVEMVMERLEALNEED